MKKPILILMLLAYTAMANAQLTPVKTDTPSQHIHDAYIPVDVQPSEQKDGDIYSAVTQPPSYPGGISKLNEYTTASLKALHNSENGKVFLEFVVEKDGSLSNIKVLRSIDKPASDMAITVMKNCPKWNPGIQNAYPVRVYYTIAMNFTSK